MSTSQLSPTFYSTTDHRGKSATLTQRWLYAGLTWVAYFALFIIALDHHEGTAGLTFRLTLGVMLVYASAEAGLLASIRTEDQADRDIFRDWQVKRYARRLARKSAMADLDLNTRMRQIDREAAEKVYCLQKARETEQRIRDIGPGRSENDPNTVDAGKPTVSTHSLDH